MLAAALPLHRGWPPAIAWVLGVPRLGFAADNTAARGGKHTMSLFVRRPAGAAKSPNSSFTVEVGYDDGTTRCPAPVERRGDHWQTKRTEPVRAGAVALRLKAEAEDEDGATVEQTLIRAYTLE
ncbi:hypothetical protein ACFY2M_33775 [Streptomyces sp. NPDC001276]|uniref:hypothetical protein n=1 Tax=Streptomyces sp. NPDC001276 TaxID=3364555 RepID=UPI003697BBAB